MNAEELSEGFLFCMVKRDAVFTEAVNAFKSLLQETHYSYDKGNDDAEKAKNVVTLNRQTVNQSEVLRGQFRT